MPVWFEPFTTTSHQALGGTLPVGPVTLVFDVTLKPWSSLGDFTDDLIVNGYVASDYSWTDFNGGMTWMLWTQSPMVTKIDLVQ